MNILVISNSQLLKHLKNKKYKCITKTQNEVLHDYNNIIAEVIIIDIDSIIESNFDFITWVKSEFTFSEIILITSIEKINFVFDILIKENLFFYIPKPINENHLQKIIDKAFDNIEKKKKLLQYEIHNIHDLWEHSPKMLKIFSTIEKIAPTDANILITGESGTGKEVMAKYAHANSKRFNEKFIAVNCGAIPENLIESELFGHKKGSFTGANEDKIGLVEEANNGTLFLDEIGELPKLMQVKLLRFLQDKSFRRVGETTERYSNVRIISATNRNLKDEIEKGNFREDLFYRINVFHIHLPPLRERKESLSNLIKYFLIKFNLLYNKNISKFDKNSLILLSKYDFPGNIRELENIIEHSVILAKDDTITWEDLPEQLKNIETNSIKSIENFSHTDLSNNSNNQNFNTPLSISYNISQKSDKNFKIKTLEEYENDYIKEVMTIFDNNTTKAAEALGISRATLWRRLKEIKKEV